MSLTNLRKGLGLSMAIAFSSAVVSPSYGGTFYLPNQLAPEAEARIERLFVLANMPTIKRPIAVNDVIKALDKVKDTDPALTQGIRQYIARYSKPVGLTHASLELGAGSDANHTLSNRRGQGTNSLGYASLSGYWAVNDFIAINAGGIYREGVEAKLGSATPNDLSLEGTFVSFGWDVFQTDIGYRGHWMGPFQDSDMLFSTNAAAMPGITFSNSQALTSFGLRYEVSLSQMSETARIRSHEQEGVRLTGNPKLFTTHLSFEPIEGFAIGFNRMLQFGGADRPEDLNSLMDAFFNAKAADNIGLEGRDFGNQLSSVTTRYTYSEGMPFSVYMEFAGEDTSAASDIHLGNSAMMYGLHLPVLPFDLDVTYEHAEWQNGWYVNGVYNDGPQNQGSTIGHWHTNYRTLQDNSGGRAHMLKILRDNYNGSSLTGTLRGVENAGDGSWGQEVSVQYAQAWGPSIIGTTVISGENVIGESYFYLSGFIRW